MDDFASSGLGECVNYPMVHHITDATVIQVNKPGGDHLESRAYFSGKHKLYCLKVEASVYPNGEACNWTAPAPGADRHYHVPTEPGVPQEVNKEICGCNGSCRSWGGMREAS